MNEHNWQPVTRELNEASLREAVYNVETLAFQRMERTIKEQDVKIINLQKDKALLIEELNQRKDVWKTAMKDILGNSDGDR